MSLYVQRIIIHSTGGLLYTGEEEISVQTCQRTCETFLLLFWSREAGRESILKTFFVFPTRRLDLVPLFHSPLPFLPSNVTRIRIKEQKKSSSKPSLLLFLLDFLAVRVLLVWWLLPLCSSLLFSLCLTLSDGETEWAVVKGEGEREKGNLLSIVRQRRGGGEARGKSGNKCVRSFMNHGQELQ